jgi:hypothetical protein
MPTLLEVQQAMHVSLVQSHDPAITAFLAEPAAVARLNIYRNTFMTSLTKALRLCYHVVQRLVGEEFFEAAAQLFVTQNPPRAAYLDQYGSDFPEFLRHLQPAASVPYLADMASLEWAVNCALHALDAELLELSKLASVAPDDQYRVRLVAHPSVRLLSVSYPVDVIWRAVLAGDDGALGSVNLGAGPAHLLVERRAAGVELARLEEPAWRFAERLFAGEPIQLVVDSTSGIDASAVLADHLASGRFVSFDLAPHDALLISRDAVS